MVQDGQLDAGLRRNTMVAPLAALGTASLAGGLAGSIFGRKQLPQFDTTTINNLVNQGAQNERGYAQQLVPGVNKNLGAFQTGVQGAENTATAAQNAAGQAYTSELDPITSRILNAQKDTLKQNLFGAVPEAENAAREALAAGGGLQRGVAAETLAKIPIQAAQQYGQGVQGLNTQSLQAKQQAQGQLFTEESAQIAEKLGIDRDTYQQILNTGDSALQTQLSNLIESSRNQTNQLVNAEVARQTGNFAAGSQNAANQNAIFNSLANLGGTALGYSLSPYNSTGVQPVENQTPKQQTAIGEVVQPISRRRTVASALAGQGA